MSTDIDHTRVKSEPGVLAASPSNATPILICDDRCSCTLVPLFNTTLYVLFWNTAISAWCLYVYQALCLYCYSIVQSYLATQSTMDGNSLEGRPLLNTILAFSALFFTVHSVILLGILREVFSCWQLPSMCYIVVPFVMQLCVTLNIFLADHCPSCVTSCNRLLPLVPEETRDYTLSSCRLWLLTNAVSSCYIEADYQLE